MFKGFYNLTSGMVTQQQNLNVVGNNMVNISTAGFKESRYAATTFDDVMYARVGNKEKIYTDIGRQSYIRANSEIKVLFDQGIPEPTGIPLDFAIMGEGFFAVQTEDGVAYTRAGNFSLDDEGYLCFPGVGRVLDPRGPDSPWMNRGLYPLRGGLSWASWGYTHSRTWSRWSMTGGVCLPAKGPRLPPPPPSIGSTWSAPTWT